MKTEKLLIEFFNHLVDNHKYTLGHSALIRPDGTTAAVHDGISKYKLSNPSQDEIASYARHNLTSGGDSLLDFLKRQPGYSIKKGRLSRPDGTTAAVHDGNEWNVLFNPEEVNLLRLYINAQPLTGADISDIFQNERRTKHASPYMSCISQVVHPTN